MLGRLIDLGLSDRRGWGAVGQLKRRLEKVSDVARQYLRSSVRAVRDAHLFADVETYCTFVGYPRSGHSLVAWLLDAHPETLIASELDALRYVYARFHKHQIYALILDRVEQEKLARAEPSGVRYSYHVPGQWQGRFDRIRVIGDKKGGASSIRLRKHPQIYDRLREVIDARLVFIHVVRNPFDNISTLAKRNGVPLSAAVERYFTMAESVAALQQRVPETDWFETYHERVVADPATVLRNLCAFLDLDAPDDYIESCAGIVRQSPNRSRDDASWPASLVESVTARLQRYQFLDHYSFSDVH